MKEWNIKKTTGNITNKKIDEIMNRALDAGAHGGKICGAGAGGFLLLYCEDNEQHKFRYNILNKKWEKISIQTKLVLHYNKNPFEKHLIKANKFLNPSEKVSNQVHITTSKSNLSEIRGVGSKRAKILELAGVKTATDLAKRSPKHLSEKTGISITHISKWIIEAYKLTKIPIRISP